MLGPHTITRLRGTESTDGYGDTKVTWPTDLLTMPGLDITGCSVQPQPNNEFTDGREALEDRNSVWAPLDADVLGGDRIRYAGRVYAVIGHPEVWDFPGLGHIKFLMRRVTG